MSKIKRLTEVEVAYLAGLIDGEGCISMTKDLHASGDRKVRYRVHLAVATTTSQILVDWLIRKLKPMKNGLNRKRENPKHATAYSVRLSEVPAEELLNRVRPYLVIKRRHADLFLRYRKIQEFSCNNRKAHRYQIKSIRKLRDWFFNEFARLNRRGPESVTANTPDMKAHEKAIMKIESELHRKMQRVVGDNAPLYA
jgi:hypothetical protein